VHLKVVIVVPRRKNGSGVSLIAKKLAPHDRKISKKFPTCAGRK
jgi:hypothetical protein